MYERRQLTGSIDGSLLRYQTYNGVEHLVAPVVALVGDVVVRPSNSLGPEYVPANVLSLIPESWNGRPVVYNHPSNDTGSANDPSILDSMCFGSMFNTTFEDKKLKAEVWLDKSRADTIGASEAVTRCANGETVEVSVGAFVLLKKESGVLDGKPYEYIWQGVIPDHLALLENGSTGACSVEMGCGTPRLMSASSLTEGGIDVTDSTKPNDQSQSSGFLRSLQRMFSWALRTNELSDSDLRWKLASLLYDVEPGFVEVVDVYHETNRVIYLCYTEREYHYYQRTFTVTNDVPALNDDRAEGKWSSEFKLFTASEDTTTTTTIVQATHACGCQSKESNNKEADEVNKIVDRLIKKNLVSESDRAKFEALPGAHLALLAKSLEGEEEEKGKTESGENKRVNQKEPETGNEIPPPTGEPKTPGAVGEQTNTAVQPGNTQTPTGNEPARALSGAQLLSSLPADDPIRKLVARAEAEEKARRASYITQLSKAQSHIKPDQLEKKSTEQLEELVGALGLTGAQHQLSNTYDYTGQGAGSTLPSTNLAANHKRPNAWGIRKDQKEVN